MEGRLGLPYFTSSKKSQYYRIVDEERCLQDLSSFKVSFYDFLVEEGEVQGNPIITRRLRVKEGQSLPDFMSVEELEIFTGLALENGGYVLRVWHGKGNKERFAPVMDADVARELVSLKGDCRDELPLFGLSGR